MRRTGPGTLRAYAVNRLKLLPLFAYLSAVAVKQQPEPLDLAGDAPGRMRRGRNVRPGFLPAFLGIPSVRPRTSVR